jgi:hypothetical protein
VPASQTHLALKAGYTPKHLADKILKARSAIEGERRQVTVLFADLAGFSALAEQRDPEEVHAIVERCFEMIATECIASRARSTSTRAMASWRCSARRSRTRTRPGGRHAALAIQRGVRDLSRELAARLERNLEMRIGLNTGPVVVGKIGDDLRMDYTAVGDTDQRGRATAAERAAGQRARRRGDAPADRRILRDRGHGPASRKGPCALSRHSRSCVRAAARHGSTWRASADSRRSVAREPELATLMDLFNRARDGRGQVVFVAGEAGIGKSRLLVEFRRRLAAAREPITWLEGRCISFGQSNPLLPVVDQLRENFGIEEFDGEPEIIAKVEHGMQRLGGLELHVPFVRYVLSVDPGDPAVAAMDASQRRKRTFDAVLAMSLRGATLRPLVFVFEDLHWVDTSTEEYLAALSDSVAATRIMIVATHRPRLLPALRHAQLSDEDHAQCAVGSRRARHGRPNARRRAVSLLT